MNENQVKQPVRRRYRKYSKDDKRNYYKAFKKSGLHPIDFCKANGISKSALYKWSKKFQNEDDDFDFSPLIVKSNSRSPLKQTQNTNDTLQLSIAFTDNPMRLSVSMAAHQLVSFIQEISDATTIVR